MKINAIIIDNIRIEDKLPNGNMLKEFNIKDNNIEINETKNGIEISINIDFSMSSFI